MITKPMRYAAGDADGQTFAQGFVRMDDQTDGTIHRSDTQILLTGGGNEIPISLYFFNLLTNGKISSFRVGSF